MHTTETQPTRIRKLTISLTDAEHAEYVRLSNERHNRTPGKQGQSVIRSWIAAEQAEEAATQAEAA
jgi:hypothetical protein